MDRVQKPGYPCRSILFLKQEVKFCEPIKRIELTFVILINFILFLEITGCSWMYTFHRYFNAFQFWRLKQVKRLEIKKSQQNAFTFHNLSLFFTFHNLFTVHFSQSAASQLSPPIHPSHSARHKNRTDFSLYGASNFLGRSLSHHNFDPSGPIMWFELL